MAQLEPIPVNLVTGFLGVGKTTALMRLLALKPADEYWAVVVNEFGEVGIDGATLSAAGQNVAVSEVPGGCICCTTSPMLQVALNKLVRTHRPDRLLIEPSGLGHPAGIIDLLREPLLAATFTVQAVVTLLDPRHLQDSRYTSHATWRDQIQLADVLVLNKCDLADVAQIDQAQAMAASLFPPKLAVVQAVKGEFAPELLDLDLHPERWLDGAVVQRHPKPEAMLKPRRRRAPVAPVAEPVWPVRKTHSSLDSHSCGWIFAPDTLFFSAGLAALFDEFSQPEKLGLSGVSRAKGVFHTERDWYRLDWVDGYPGAAPAAWRRDSRVEVIVQASTQPDWAALEARLMALRVA